MERIDGFRPLELSIYLPGNELPSLPIFSHDYEEGEVGLIYAAPVLNKARSESLLSRPSTSFTIARKPITSRTLSFDGSRFSLDSQYAPGDLDFAFGTKLIHQRPGIATTRSTQDFLDTLDSCLPQLPTRLRSKSGPEPVYTLYRRASEQSLRLRTHLEEREEIERRLPECDTILEEKQGVERKYPNLSPISSHGDPAEELPLPHPELKPTYPSSLSQPHSETSQETVNASKPPTDTNPHTTRARISQWLLRSASSQSSRSLASSSDEGFPRRSSTVRDRTSTASSAYSNADTADLASAWSSPRSSPHRKGSSVSSWQTGMYFRGLSVEGEKRPALPSVGIAY